MKLFITVLSIAVTTNAFAFPLRITSRVNPFAPATSTLAALIATASYDFEGAVAFSNCSGSVIRLETAADADKAWVLTNGHCTSPFMIRPGKVKRNETASRRISVYNKDTSTSTPLVARKLLYGTMTKTDMAIYQLDETYGELLQDHSLEAYTLSSADPTVGTDLEIVSGYWKRGYSCKIEKIVPTLKEEGWTMEQSLRYSRPGCDIIGGTSGSPVLKAGTREVVAINNTSNEDGEKCTMNNPCEYEAGAGKTIAIKGYAYAQQTAWLYTCLNSKREIDLDTPGCKLPK